MTKGIWTPDKLWKGRKVKVTIGDFTEIIPIQNASHYWKIKRLIKAEPNTGRN